MPSDGMNAALAAYFRRRKELARRYRSKRCHVCGDKIAPGDPLWLYDGGVQYVEDGDDGYLEQFEEHPADDLDGLARRESYA